MNPFVIDFGAFLEEGEGSFRACTNTLALRFIQELRVLFGRSSSSTAVSDVRQKVQVPGFQENQEPGRPPS